MTETVCYTESLTADAFSERGWCEPVVNKYGRISLLSFSSEVCRQQPGAVFQRMYAELHLSKS